MTDLKTYFASGGTAASNGTGTKSAVNGVCETDALPTNASKADDALEDVSKFVVKTARPNSKLILQNMEEVLNSVKKQHRQKHRRKREQRKLAAQMEAAAAAAAAATNGRGEMQHKKTKSEKKHHHKRLKPKPLQEKTTQDNGEQQSRHSKQKVRKSPLKSTSPNGSILKHFQRTPKKHESQEVEEQEVVMVMVAETTGQTSQKHVKPVNAFEIMMNARNKSIGSNTPGKEPSPTLERHEEAAASSAKRKLVLQEWAEKKGSTKRKLEEEERAAYVEQQLENRAKKLKQMLVSGGGDSPKVTARRSVEQTSTRKSDVVRNKMEERPKRRSRTARRLSSSDSEEPIPTEIASRADAETAEFLSKLSSPTKKRDSLLGYFPRKDSGRATAVRGTKSQQEQKANETTVDYEGKAESPKVRGRRAAKKLSGTVGDVIEILETSTTEQLNTTATSEAVNTSSGRPRRSCVGRARYDYDFEESPIKLDRCITKTHKVAKKTLQVEVEIIDLESSNSSLTPSKVPKKLAPVFVRSVPKPGPDPAVLKARQDFLMSGVPEKMRLEMAKQKLYEQTYEDALQYFPRICHVQQISAEELEFLHKRKETSYKLIADEQVEATAASAHRKTKSRGRSGIGGNTNSSGKSPRAAQRKVSKSLTPASAPTFAPLPTLENKRDVIKAWKREFERFPTYKCYNQMREKYRYFSALDSAQDTEQVSESFVVTRHTQRAYMDVDSMSEDAKPPATAPNGELLFTEKYKPMLLEQVLVNLVPVTQLRDFLASWADGNGSGSARNSQNLEDTMEAANDSNSSQSVVCNTVVLLGPVSSGKTNAVFALANDMNFNVLEINAGMKRTGKRLIQELQEATQSHQIRKDSTASSSKSQKHLLKMSLNGLKYKKLNSQDSDCSIELSQSERKCLILIEDADVVFEQLDAGFIDAIYTLAASSKRPVIVVASNPNCAHLQRLMNQNTINFAAPNAISISKFLAVLSLIENCPVRLEDLISLYTYNDKDLRRTLLELEFFIQSGGDRKHVLAQQEQQRIPQKQTVSPTKRETEFFASPSKCRLVADVRGEQTQEQDDQLDKESGRLDNGSTEGKESSKNHVSNDDVYVHSALFEFYTGNQNEKWRIPFPVDFSLFRSNLAELLQVAPKLKMQQVPQVDEENIAILSNTAAKRKSRSPKKVWLSSATSSNSNTTKRPQSTPLDALCDFYENVSIAALLGEHDVSESNCFDRLLPRLEETIAHELVEKAIDVNLAVDTYPYNLCDTRTGRYSVAHLLGGTTLRSERTCALDFEPALRTICRSEKLRASQERRSTRFYHYLRHSMVNLCNFSTEPFDAACGILQETTIELTAEQST